MCGPKDLGPYWLISKFGDWNENFQQIEGPFMIKLSAEQTRTHTNYGNYLCNVELI